MLSDMLRKRSTKFEDKKYCVELLKKNGSLQYTADVLELIEREVRSEVGVIINLKNELL